MAKAQNFNSQTLTELTGAIKGMAKMKFSRKYRKALAAIRKSKLPTEVVNGKIELFVKASLPPAIARS